MGRNRQRPDRKTLNPMGIGILHSGNCCTLKIPSFSSLKKNTLYIDILNQSDGGFCIRTPHLPLNEDMRFYLELYDKQTQTWPIYYCKGVWIQENAGSYPLFLIGCQFHKTNLELDWSCEDKEQNVPSPQDFSFIQQTRFFQSIDRGGAVSLFKRPELLQNSSRQADHFPGRSRGEVLPDSKGERLGVCGKKWRTIPHLPG